MWDSLITKNQPNKQKQKFQPLKTCLLLAHHSSFYLSTNTTKGTQIDISVCDLSYRPSCPALQLRGRPLNFSSLPSQGALVLEENHKHLMQLHLLCGNQLSIMDLTSFQSILFPLSAWQNMGEALYKERILLKANTRHSYTCSIERKPH